MTIFAISIFPRDYRDAIKSDDSEEILSILDQRSHPIVEGSINYSQTNGIEFIGCGANLKKVKCNYCSHTIHKEEWEKIMKKDYENGTGYKMQKYNFGCCDERSKLSGLRYLENCGFSKSVITFNIYTHFFIDWLGNFPHLTCVSAKI
jgi:hypothetical protein